MEVVPESVGKASRSWDEQHLDLAAAAVQVRDADPAGFTSAVRGAARSFTTKWHAHTDALATACEAHADDLRGVIERYVTSEEYVRDHVLGPYDPITAYLTEVR